MTIGAHEWEHGFVLFNEAEMRFTGDFYSSIGEARAAMAGLDGFVVKTAKRFIGERRPLPPEYLAAFRDLRQ